MSFMSEFKEFAMKGNVVDLAVGVIIGAAFGKIVSSFVDGIVMPLLGIGNGGVNFSEMGYDPQGRRPQCRFRLVPDLDFGIRCICPDHF